MWKMKELPKNERPREHLILKGVESLNNEELLSILLTSGGKENTVKELSISLIKEFGGMENLSSMTYEKLIQMKGIGPAKACVLLASMEFGKRISKKDFYGKKIDSARLVYDYYVSFFQDKKQEYFCCMYLDTQKRIIKEKVLFIGTLNQSLVHPREVLKEALLLSASSMICVHNHPTGDPIPSKADQLLTERLKQAGLIIGIPLNDHVIVGKDSYFSFYENRKEVVL